MAARCTSWRSHVGEMGSTIHQKECGDVRATVVAGKRTHYVVVLSRSVATASLAEAKRIAQAAIGKMLKGRR